MFLLPTHLRVHFENGFLTVFAHPTLAEFTRRITAAATEAAIEGVLAIRRSGSQPPLFLVHDMKGVNTWFSVLAANVRSDVPVYGLTAWPLNETCPDTMEAIAAR